MGRDMDQIMNDFVDSFLKDGYGIFVFKNKENTQIFKLYKGFHLKALCHVLINKIRRGEIVLEDSRTFLIAMAPVMPILDYVDLDDDEELL